MTTEEKNSVCSQQDWDRRQFPKFPQHPVACMASDVHLWNATSAKIFDTYIIGIYYFISASYHQIEQILSSYPI